MGATKVNIYAISDSLPRKIAILLCCVCQESVEKAEKINAEGGGKVINLFSKMSQLRHTPIKKGLGEKP
jgi:hypothetical protein